MVVPSMFGTDRAQPTIPIMMSSYRILLIFTLSTTIRVGFWISNCNREKSVVLLHKEYVEPERALVKSCLWPLLVLQMNAW